MVDNNLMQLAKELLELNNKERMLLENFLNASCEDQNINESKQTKERVKCPECLCSKTQEELDMFGGLCEECSGAFDE